MNGLEFQAIRRFNKISQKMLAKHFGYNGSSVKISKKTTLTCCNKIRLLQYYFILLLTTFIGIT